MGAVTSTRTAAYRCPQCGAEATATVTRETDDTEAEPVRVAVQCPNGCQLTRAELATVVRTLA